jgi:hypothetical protein
LLEKQFHAASKRKTAVQTAKEKETVDKGAGLREVADEEARKDNADLKPLGANDRSPTVEGLMAMNCFAEALQECLSYQERNPCLLPMKGKEATIAGWQPRPYPLDAG